MTEAEAREILEIYWLDWWIENRQPDAEWQSCADLVFLGWVLEERPELKRLRDSQSGSGRQRLELIVDNLRRDQIAAENSLRE